MRLYHFLSQKYALEALRNKRIKVSTIDKLNDPFEFHAGFLNPNPEIENIFSRWKAKTLKEQGILCFSKGWHNPLLWSHYAEKHTGFALGFELPDNVAIKVKYTEDRPLYPSDKVLEGAKHNKDFLVELVRTKSLSWAYEEEVRVGYALSTLDLENGLYFDRFGSDLILKEVITGCNNALSNEKLLSLLGEFEKITVIRSKKHLKLYQIVKENEVIL
jgi:hypothetical protein